MELYVLNEFDSAHDFAMDMQKRMEDTSDKLPVVRIFYIKLLCSSLCQQ